uniref:Envelope fusion protein n=1 Tax=Glossina brevipalpis TaxID=37001 RepID=A0A1A9W982_9MUSC
MKAPSPLSVPLLLLAITLFIPLIASSVNITSVQSGIYIERVGTAYINHGLLKMKLTVPWKEVKADINIINKLNENISTLCSHAEIIAAEEGCKNLVYEFQEEVREVEHKTDTLRFLQSRQRRGILGTVLTSIFGVNDEVYRDIDKLDSNQRKLIKLNQKHGKILLDTMQSMKAANEKISLQMSSFDDQFIKLYTIFDGNTVSTQFMNAYQLALNLVNLVDKKYSALLDSIYTKASLLNCITTRELITLINNTESVLPPNLKVSHIPMNRIDMLHTAEELLLSGYFQIIETTKFEVIQPTAIPKRIENTLYAVLQIKPNPLAVDDLQLFYELNQYDIDSVNTVLDNTMIIDAKTAYHFSGQQNCVVSEIYHAGQAKQCSTQVVNVTQTIWKELYNKNSWLFIASTPTSVYSLCHGQRSDVTLQNVRILHINSTCSVHTPEFALMPEQESEVFVEAFLKIREIVINTTISPSTEIGKDNEYASWKELTPHIISGSSIVILCIVIASMMALYIKHNRNNTSPSKSSRTWYDVEVPFPEVEGN